MIAVAQHNLGEPQPLTLFIRFHTRCFAHHTPRCVDMPESSNFNIQWDYRNIQWDHRPSLTSALALQLVVAAVSVQVRVRVRVRV